MLRSRLVVMWRFIWPGSDSLTSRAVKCYETAEECKSLREALAWIAKGDALLKKRKRKDGS